MGDRDSRYVICSGNYHKHIRLGISNSIYIFDLWKMRCTRVYHIGEPIFSAVCIINKGKIGAISSKSLVYQIDATKYQRKEK